MRMGTKWWHNNDAPTPEEWMAFFAALTFAAALVAAVIALRQLRAHFATERSQSRPYVIVDFAFRSFLMQIEIKNIGATAATDLMLRVDRPFESGKAAASETLNSVFSGTEVIPMLAPGRRILYLLDSAPDYLKDERPERYVVTASYADLPVQYSRPWRRSWKSQPVRHEDTYVLDFRQWSKSVAEVDYPNKNWNIAKSNERQIKKVAEALKSIADELRDDTDDE